MVVSGVEAVKACGVQACSVKACEVAACGVAACGVAACGVAASGEWVHALKEMVGRSLLHDAEVPERHWNRHILVVQHQTQLKTRQIAEVR